MVTPKSGPALMLNNVKKININKFQCLADDDMLTVTGSRNRQISISESSISKENIFISEKAIGSVTINK